MSCYQSRATALSRDRWSARCWWEQRQGREQGDPHQTPDGWRQIVPSWRCAERCRLPGWRRGRWSWSFALFELKSFYRVRRAIWGWWWTVPRLSHYVDAVSSIQSGIVLTPIGEALQQQVIIRTMMQFNQPCRGAAMLCLKHRDQGGDDTGASSLEHGWVVVCLNWSHYRHRVRTFGVAVVPLRQLVLFGD